MTVFRNDSTPLPPIPDNLTIPQFILREHQLSVRPVRPSNVPYFIDNASGRAYNYEEVHHRTFGLANALSIKWNIGPKDVVCLFCPNDVDYANCIWAVHTLGGIVAPTNPASVADELVYQLSITKAKLIITHPVCLVVARKAAKMHGLPETCIILIQNDKNSPSGIPTLDELIKLGSSKPENYRSVRLEPGEAKTTVAFFCFSSGTTGKPKAVAISHYAIVGNVIQTATHYHVNNPSRTNKLFEVGDVILGILPFFHIYGLVVIIHFSLFCGASVVSVPKFKFEESLNSITRHKVTHLLLVPPQIVLLCKHPAMKGRTFSQVKYCLSGAAPLGGDLMNRMAKVFPNSSIGQGFGMTEGCTIAMLSPDRKIGTLGSAGMLIPGVEAKVLKADGSLGKEGEQGELVVTGPGMALGYHSNPAATAETFVDGWVRTGDEVFIRNNEIFVVDRVKEIMKVRGFQVAPAELEARLLTHPSVRDACVVGIPDEYSGEIPLAFIVPTQGALEKIGKGASEAQNVKVEIQKHISDTKVQYKWLTGGVEFIDEIPKNPSGKILRRFLRDKARTTRTPNSLKLKARL